MKITNFKNFYLGLFLSRFVFVCSCALVFVCSYAMADDISRICFHQHCFTVDIADTAETRARGLMFRDHLPEDHGMLFVFPSDGVRAFWMKDTLIPLDMIWLDKDLRILHLEENVQPCEHDPCPSYRSARPARYVLELNAGTAREIGLKPGDVMQRGVLQD